jgi:hypothetical protein
VKINLAQDHLSWDLLNFYSSLPLVEIVLWNLFAISKTLKKAVKVFPLQKQRMSWNENWSNGSQRDERKERERECVPPNVLRTHTLVSEGKKRERVRVSATPSSLCSYCAQWANEIRERTCACMFVLSLACAGPKGWENCAVPADVVAVIVVAVVVAEKRAQKKFEFREAKMSFGRWVCPVGAYGGCVTVKMQVPSTKICRSGERLLTAKHPNGHSWCRCCCSRCCCCCCNSSLMQARWTGPGKMKFETKLTDHQWDQMGQLSIELFLSLATELNWA